jgi:ankyrin repeat protein
MKIKPVVDELLHSIQELYYQRVSNYEYSELWASYQGSIDKLSKTNLNAILHCAVCRHTYLLGERYGAESRSTLYQIIASLLDHGADPNSRFDDEIALAKTVAPEVIQLLLQHGADPNRSDGGKTPMNDSSLTAEAVILLLAAGADPNARSSDGYTPLETLCGNSECLRLLLEAGADPNQHDAQGKTVLMDGYLDLEALKVLLQGGADPNARDVQGRTPLMFVTRPELVKELHARGADFNARDNEGRTVLMHALVLGFQCAEALVAMIKAGAPVNVVDKDGNYALSFSRQTNKWYTSEAEFIELLLINGATPDLPNNRGETPLMHWAGNAEIKGCRKIVELLLKRGADIHLRDDWGMDALMHAAKNGNQRVIKLLLSKKADTTGISKIGRSCLEWALSGKNLPDKQLVDLLLDGGANINGNPKSHKLNLLGKFLLAPDIPYCMTLLKRGARVNFAMLSTMGISLAAFSKRGAYTEAGTESDSPIETLLELARLEPGIFLAATDTEEAELAAVLKPWTQQKPSGKKHADNGLAMFGPANWPPYVAQRKQIVIGGVRAKEHESRLEFTEDEIENYFNEGVADHNLSSGFCHYRSISAGKKSEEEQLKAVDKKVEQKKSLLFKDTLRVSDQALIHLWNDVISTNPNLFMTGSRGWTYRPISSPESKFVLARCGIAVLPGILNLARTKPNVLLRVLLPVADTKLAPLMANRLLGSPVSRIARKWFVRHPEVAIHGLIPFAVGPVSEERASCEAALRYLASQGRAADIKKAAVHYGKDAVKSIKEILSVDRCSDYHRKPLLEIPAELFGDAIKRPIVLAMGEPLPERCLPALFGMMSLSTYDDVYPALLEIRERLEPDSLADFAWSAFEFWDGLGSSSKFKKSMEWIFHSLAYLGNDHTVKPLASRVQSWPREGGMPNAVIGIQILANIGSEAAIRTISAILLKTKYKPLLERAAEIMEVIADVRGLTAEQLDDRLVPTLDLDEDGQMTLDFGPRAFSIQIDEKLKPAVLDANGKVVLVLPAAIKSDDRKKVKEATQQWKMLKAGLMAEATTQLLRLEQSMIQQRRWTGAEFKTLLAEHPLLRHVVSSLIWAEYEGSKPKTTFRVDKDGGLLTKRAEIVNLNDAATVGIPHPLAIKSQLKGWGECLARHKVRQAFPQIGRQCFAPKDDRNNDLFGIQGGKAPTKVFRGMRAKGWKAEIGDGGSIWGFYKSLPGGTVSLELDGIVTGGDVGQNDDEQTISVRLPKKLAPMEYSELARELKELLH